MYILPQLKICTEMDLETYIQTVHIGQFLGRRVGKKGDFQGFFPSILNLFLEIILNIEKLHE